MKREEEGGPESPQARGGERSRPRGALTRPAAVLRRARAANAHTDLPHEGLWSAEPVRTSAGRERAERVPVSRRGEACRYFFASGAGGGQGGQGQGTQGERQRAERQTATAAADGARTPPANEGWVFWGPVGNRGVGQGHSHDAARSAWQLARVLRAPQASAKGVEKSLIQEDAPRAAFFVFPLAAAKRRIASKRRYEKKGGGQVGGPSTPRRICAVVRAKGGVLEAP
jgi:hypothetical protein